VPAGYVFGPFTLDCRKQRLLRDGELLPLAGKTFEVLRALIEHRDRLVEKEELLRLVWPDVVVDEANLTQHIFTVRKLLGDSSQNARYVLTVSRRGYRFIADVLEVVEEAPSGDVPGRARNLPAIRALAILPLAAISGSDEEYLGLGLADGVIARLAKLATVPVRPTSAIRRYTAVPHDLSHVARELRVDAVVEGTIRRDADRIRVTVQLVHVRSSAPLWADQFDTALSNLFSVEDSISTRIAESLVVTLTGDLRRRLVRHNTESGDAYLARLKGRYYFNRRTPESLHRAVEYFNQAIERDPLYALAYADLADCYALGAASSVTRRDSVGLARAAVLKALDLDEELAEAHASLASLAYRWDWDFAAAEREFRRAIELNPSAASVRHSYALFLALQGRFDEALVEMTRAGELDPLSLPISAGIGRVLDLARRPSDAIAQYKRTIDVDPSFAEVYFDLAIALRHVGRCGEALEADHRAVALAPAKPAYRSSLAVSYVHTGHRHDAQREMNELAALAQRTYVSPVVFALVAIAFDDSDGALTQLEQAVDERSAEVLYLGVDPDFDPLRRHARFQSLLARIGVGGG
jgi:DNA-binding winged helix-turn-helix (wHTH) protein/tetratricopeptide (TPR) repeat protein